MTPRKHIAYANIDENGVPHGFDKQGILDFCKLHPNGRLEVEYKIVKSTAGTEQQMRYYRGVVIPNIQTGLRNIGYTMTPTQVHDYLRNRSAIGVTFVDVKTVSLPIIESTSSFDKEDWIDYIDECIRHAAEELAIVVPEPTYERYDLTKLANK